MIIYAIWYQMIINVFTNQPISYLKLIWYPASKERSGINEDHLVNDDYILDIGMIGNTSIYFLLLL